MQNADPFVPLIRHMRRLGHALTALCLAWVTVVGLSLVIGVPQGELHNHRSPVVREAISQCAGAFSERYDCSETILLTGERIDVVGLAARFGVTMLLPAVAWAVWHAAMRSTLEMRTAVTARLIYEQRRAERRARQSPLPA